MEMLHVKVEQLFFSNMGFVVLLKGPADERTLPIFIGAAEAQAIALQINNVKMSRPLTHDLFKNTLDFLECRVKRIEVCDLKEGTFYAKLILERDGMEMGIDSRPSDAGGSLLDQHARHADVRVQDGYGPGRQSLHGRGTARDRLRRGTGAV